MNSVCIVLFVLGCAIFADAVELRRDDTWPPKDLLAILHPIHDTCAAKIQVTDEAIRKFSDEEIHEDEKLKCYMSCIFHEANIVDDEGHLHMEKLNLGLEQFDDEVQSIVNAMTKQCLTPEGNTHCETAFWYHKCWKTADPRHYFLI